MNRIFSTLAGLMLVAAGVAGLLLSWVPQWLGLGHYGGIWQMWPLFIIGPGLCLGVTPLIIHKRGLGGLFIPALPLLTTGGILLWASLFNYWRIWAWAWPLEVLSLAVAFLLFALYARNAWIAIPAIFLGLTGAVLQFCALTHLWHWWSFLWTVEPLAVGFTLLLVAAKTRSTVVLVVGLCICALSGAAAAGMLALLTGLWRVANLVWAVGLIALGGVLLAWTAFGARARPAVQAPPAAS